MDKWTERGIKQLAETLGLNTDDPDGPAVTAMADARIRRLEDENERLRKWVAEGAIALRAASIIGESEGIHLNYGNQDRLLRKAVELLPQLQR